MDAQKQSLWDLGQDEAVSVNQRALIDKVLARYSGENTIFRELLQNSDDAEAKSVQLHFFTAAGAAAADQAAAAAAAGSDAAPSSPADLTGLIERPVVSVPDLKNAEITRYVFKNDGMPFRPEDWARLKSIASGNPDESKVGAFGVGFYSLFSVTEEPWVESGETFMGFYWKNGGDQLFARSGPLPTKRPTSSSHFSRPFTSFSMDLRSPSPLPSSPLELARFLATSITFMRTIERAEIFVDGLRLVLIERELGPKKPVEVPAGLERKSKGGVMFVDGLSSTDVRISACILRLTYTSSAPPPPPPPKLFAKPAITTVSTFSSMFSSVFRSAPSSRSLTPVPPPPEPEKIKEKDPLEVIVTDLALRIVAASVQVSVSKAFGIELERATKKPPPKQTSVALVFTGREAWEEGEAADGVTDADKVDEEGKGEKSVFRGLRADLDGRGLSRVFIGHATGQTTGMAGHLSARFIPTVERESIDLVDRHVAVWNRELLHVAGFLCRAVYEMEVASIATLWAASSSPASLLPPPETVKWLTDRFVHILRFFSFFPSTPSSVVARELEAAFFLCVSKAKGIPFLTELGVKEASVVRMPQPAVESFVKQVPVVPTAVLAASPLILDQLKLRGMLRDLSLEDVINELKNSVLNETQMVAALHWWILLSQSPGFDPSFRRRFLDVAVYSYQPLGEGGAATGEEAVLSLAVVQSYPNPRMGLPVDLPLPPNALPFSTAKTLPLDKLQSALGFKELTIPQWLAHLASDTISAASIQRSPALAERVLGILAKSWNGLSPAAQSAIFGTLSDKTVVPTRSGLSLPGEAYHPNVSLFPDLPVVAFPGGTQVKGQMERLLIALGVRRHVELQLVFNRLLGAGGSIVDLVNYLVSVRETLTSTEMAKLRETPAFPQQGAGVRVVPGALFEPSEELRQSGLPLPFLDWPVKWRSISNEAKLLFDLGLMKQPPIDTLLTFAADAKDGKLRSAALAYLTANFAKHYATTYSRSPNRKLPFLPCIRPDGSAAFDSPLKIYTNPSCTALGLSVVASSAREFAITALKVPADPPAEHLVAALLRSPPRDVISAQRCYEYLGTKVSSLPGAAIDSLYDSAIVPVLDANSKIFALKAPKDVYLADANRESVSKGYKSLFTFVDFGSSGANTFLRSLGVRDEPSPADVASLLVSKPQHFLQLAGTPEAYLDVLRNISASRVPRSTLKAMSGARVLLCHRRVRLSTASDSLEDDDFEDVYELAYPNEIVILDEPVASQLFVDELLAAPEDSALEEFYLSLGSHRLSKLVTEDWRDQGPFRDQATLAINVKKLVLERAPIFLNERPKALFNYATLQRQLEVFEARSLLLRRTLTVGAKKKIKEETSSAAAFRERTRIRLLVSASIELDLYDLSAALTKVLLPSPRASDALLLYTLLSTPLPSLKRRGFNTDRILKLKRAERLAEEALASSRAEEERKMASLETELRQMFPNASTTEVRLALAGHESDHLAHAANTLLELEKTRPPPPSHEVLNQPDGGAPTAAAPLAEKERSLAKRSPAQAPVSTLKPPKGLFSSIRDTIRRPETRNGAVETGGSRLNGVPPRPQEATTSPPTTTPTPQGDIRANVEKIVNASRGNRASSIVSEQKVTSVKEAAEDYCSVDGAKTDLVFIADIPLPGAKMQFFAERSLPNARAFLEAHSGEASRFASTIILPLCGVFKLDPASLHMFYDQAGPLIAFNRGGSLFVNLRYYEAWHDAAVKAGVLEDALCSWYFSLAHECAHNMVQSHNAQFSYWASSIAEHFLQPFTLLLASVR